MTLVAVTLLMATGIPVARKIERNKTCRVHDSDKLFETFTG